MTAHDPFMPGANISIRSVPNLRDIGGYATMRGGRVRPGVLYRSAALSQLADADRHGVRRPGPAHRLRLAN